MFSQYSLKDELLDGMEVIHYVYQGPVLAGSIGHKLFQILLELFHIQVINRVRIWLINVMDLLHGIYMHVVLKRIRPAAAGILSR